MYYDFNLRCPRAFEFFRLNESLEFKRRVQDRLSARRFEHCLAVGEMLYELDRSVGRNTSLVLGLAHDFTKEIPDSQTLEMIWKNKLPLYEGEMENRQTLHAVTAAFLFRKVFPAAPLTYSFAIRHHTILSCEYFSDICFNLYVADKIDRTRSHISEEFRNSIICEKTPLKRAYRILSMQDSFLESKGVGFLKCTSALYERLRIEYGSD